MIKLGCNDVTVYAETTVFPTIRVIVEAGGLQKWTYEFRTKAYCRDPTFRQFDLAVYSRKTKRHKYKQKEGRFLPPSEVFEHEVIRKVVESAVVALAKNIRFQFEDVVGYLSSPIVADTITKEEAP